MNFNFKEMDESKPINTNQKQCIWCRKLEHQVSFKKLAHTIPKSLGGINICKNVCDICNEFFGNHFQGNPSVETVIKETFNITRARFLDSYKTNDKVKQMKRFSSIYFDVDFKKYKVDLKLSYRNQKNFQEKIGRQIKKGLYKIYLEEIERQFGEGLNPKYDFIREFCRYDLGDYPVFYFERLHGMIFMSQEWAKHPRLFIDPKYKMKYLVDEPCFFEFEFLGHVFGIATSRYWELNKDNYIKTTNKAKRNYFSRWVLVKYFNDIDLTLRVIG